MPALRCPRCLSALPSPSASEGARVPLSECPNCGGVWASGAAPERLRQTLEGNGHAGEGHPHARARFDTRDAVSCPECKTPMVRFTHQESGVVLDACAAHGIFFDCDELEQVARAAEAHQASTAQAQPSVRPAGGPPPLPARRLPEESLPPIPRAAEEEGVPTKVGRAAGGVLVFILEGLLS